MRRLGDRVHSFSGIMLALLALTFGGQTALAAPMPFTGDLRVYLGPLRIFDPSDPLCTETPPHYCDWTFRAPFQGTADVTGGVVSLPAGLVSATNQLRQINWDLPPGFFTGVVVTMANGAGSFAPGGAAAACPGPLAGGAGACVAGGGIGGAMPLSGLIQVKGQLAINVPLSVVGQNGEVVQTVGMYLAQGAPWTTGAARFTTTGPNMVTAVFAGTASGPAGAANSSLTLVTPMHINVGDFARLPGFATLSLHFVPEPGTFALVLATLPALAVAARRRVARD